MLLLVAAGPLMPAVPAVSFEPERLQPKVPPASAAINTAAIAFLNTGSIIISSSLVSIECHAFRPWRGAAASTDRAHIGHLPQKRLKIDASPACRHGTASQYATAFCPCTTCNAM
ncbi:hypothetical protein [Paraburkholderia phenoliruptrix]